MMVHIVNHKIRTWKEASHSSTYETRTGRRQPAQGHAPPPPPTHPIQSPSSLDCQNAPTPPFPPPPLLLQSTPYNDSFQKDEVGHLMEEEDQGEWPSKMVTTVQQAHAVTKGLCGSSSVVNAHENMEGQV